MLPRRLISALLSAAAATAALPAAAQAAPCGPALNDAAGRPVTVSASDGSISTSGATLGTAYILGAPIAVPDPNSCSTEESGREIVYPEQPVGPPSAGLFVTRKTYVPSAGRPFLRFLTVIRNASGAAQAVDMRAYGGHAASRVRGSASGDLLVTQQDAWAVLADQPAPSPPTSPGPDIIGHLWDGPGAPAGRHLGIATDPGPFSPPFSEPGNTPTARYQVAVPAGGSAAVMTLALSRDPAGGGLDGALADAAALAAAPPEVYAGLGADELRALVNWPDPDPDGDGVRLNADNCPAGANPGQENLDGDALGDACDPDIDGDGLSNVAEAALGANARVVDSDGDGRADGSDSCPKTPGVLPDFCPASAAGDTSPSAITGPALSAPSKLTRKAFLKGVSVRAGCAERCSVLVELRATSKGAVRLAAKAPASRILLGAASSPRRDGVRAIRIRPSAALVGRARKLTVQVRAVLTDAGGNQRTITRTIRVG